MAAREAVRASVPPVFEDPPLILDGIAFFTNGLPEWREKTRTMVAEFLKKQGVLPVNGSQK